MKPLLIFLLLSAPVAWAQQVPTPTIRICDDTGCSDRPRQTATFSPASNTTPAEDERLDLLTSLARKDPRAAYDLGLRYFRGDGVRQDSYQALQWMRDAAERGDRQAQTAVGRFYLMGLDEMGSDPAEAEKWLAMAAARGDQDAKKLLAQARAAKKSDAEYRRWQAENRSAWQAYWASRYGYRWSWKSGRWHER